MRTDGERLAEMLTETGLKYTEWPNGKTNETSPVDPSEESWPFEPVEETIMTVPEMLRSCAETYEQRNEMYGDNYKNFGNAMRGFFPRGVALNTSADQNRYGVLVQIVGKIGRYCAQFETGGHDDSLLDISVYAQMLRELDQEIEKAKLEGCPF